MEDGARAKVIEECVSALAYDYARQHAYLEDVPAVGYPLLKAIRGLVADREVRACSLHEWERAILGCYAVWRRVWADRGGVVVGDLLARTYEYRPAG